MKILLGVAIGVIMTILMMCKIVSHVSGIRLKHVAIIYVGSMAMTIGVPADMVANVTDKLMGNDDDINDTLLKFEHMLETPAGELIEECENISE